MASPTAILPILLLLTLPTLSLTFSDQPNTPPQYLTALISSPSTEPSLPPPTLPSYPNNLASTPIPPLITDIHDAAGPFPSPWNSEAVLLPRNLPPLSSKTYTTSTSTITLAQTTRTTISPTPFNTTVTSTGIPSNKTKTNNNTGILSMSSNGSGGVRVVDGANATVLPPEPRFTSAGPGKSEAGREGGRGMGLGRGMVGVLVVVGVGIWGGMVVL